MTKLALLGRLRTILDDQQPTTVTGPNGQACITVPPRTSLLVLKEFVDSCIAFGAEQQKDSDIHRWNEASAALLAALPGGPPKTPDATVWIVRDSDRYIRGVFRTEQAARQFKDKYCLATDRIIFDTIVD